MARGAAASAPPPSGPDHAGNQPRHPRPTPASLAVLCSFVYLYKVTTACTIGAGEWLPFAGVHRVFLTVTAALALYCFLFVSLVDAGTVPRGYRPPAALLGEDEDVEGGAGGEGGGGGRVGGAAGERGPFSSSRTPSPSRERPAPPPPSSLCAVAQVKRSTGGARRCAKCRPVAAAVAAAAGGGAGEGQKRQGTGPATTAAAATATATASAATAPYKPPRSHHCRVCGVCRLRMDHHCHFAAACVGHRNYRAYLLLLLYAGGALSHVVLLVVARFGVRALPPLRRALWPLPPSSSLSSSSSSSSFASASGGVGGGGGGGRGGGGGVVDKVEAGEAAAAAATPAAATARRRSLLEAAADAVGAAVAAAASAAAASAAAAALGTDDHAAAFATGGAQVPERLQSVHGSHPLVAAGTQRQQLMQQQQQQQEQQAVAGDGAGGGGGGGGRAGPSLLACGGAELTALALAAPACVGVLWLGWWHLKLVLANKTTVEHVEGVSVRPLAGAPPPPSSSSSSSSSRAPAALAARHAAAAAMASAGAGAGRAGAPARAASSPALSSLLALPPSSSAGANGASNDGNPKGASAAGSGGGRGRGRDPHHPWDLGPWQNAASVLGPSPWLWLVPPLAPPKGGLSFRSRWDD